MNDKDEGLPVNKSVPGTPKSRPGHVSFSNTPAGSQRNSYGAEISPSKGQAWFFQTRDSMPLDSLKAGLDASGKYEERESQASINADPRASGQSGYGERDVGASPRDSVQSVDEWAFESQSPRISNMTVAQSSTIEHAEITRSSQQAPRESEPLAMLKEEDGTSATISASNAAQRDSGQSEKDDWDVSTGPRDPHEVELASSPHQPRRWSNIGVPASNPMASTVLQNASGLGASTQPEIAVGTDNSVHKLLNKTVRPSSSKCCKIL